MKVTAEEYPIFSWMVMRGMVYWPQPSCKMHNRGLVSTENKKVNKKYEGPQPSSLSSKHLSEFA